MLHLNLMVNMIINNVLSLPMQPYKNNVVFIKNKIPLYSSPAVMRCIVMYYNYILYKLYTSSITAHDDALDDAQKFSTSYMTYIANC